MSEEPEDWRWANAEGVISAINELELIASLSRGRIAASSLVWRKGWAEWIPAAQVRELAAALPETQRAQAVLPRRDPERAYPPPLPAGQVRPGPVGNVSKPPPKPPKPPPSRKHTPVPVTRPSRPPLPGSPLVTPIPPPRVSTLPGPDFRPPSRPPDARAPIPTLVDMPDATATGTLRPPGAVPPPPRAVPPTPRNFEVLDELPELTPTGPITPIPNVTTPRRLGSPPVPNTEFATQPSASETPLPDSDTPDPITQRDAMRAFRNRPTEPPTRRRSQNPSASAGAGGTASQPPEQSRELPRRYAIALFGLSILAGLLAVTVIYLLLGSTTEPETAQLNATPSTALASAAAPEELRTPGCQVLSQADRLSTSIVGSIPPNLAVSESAPRVAIGFAENASTASGLVFDLPGLQTQRMFTQSVEQRLLGVVPVLSGKEFRFVVDVEQEELRSQRTVSASTPFVIGLGEAGIVRNTPGAALDPIWAEPIQERITEMRVATFPGEAHAVTFRRGGQSGTVLFGWLSADGRKRSELARITAAGLSGTPTVAQNGKTALLSYAWRPNADVYWSVQLAQVPLAAPPEKSHQFQIPPGGPGAEAISPAATGLPEGRWLLQWTEGSTGARQVRAQVLNADLSPHGKAFTLSRPDQNAGQGALISHRNSALALFLVTKGGGHELWGASLKCP